MTFLDKIFQVDAFTDTPFKGNPAGVMIVDENFSSEKMQHIASEMNLSETAFVIPQGTSFQIRYFTPTREVPLCGHATLAAAHIMYELGLKQNNESIEFVALGGALVVHKEQDFICMNFPTYSLTQIPIPKHCKESIGFEPLEVYSSMYDWVIFVAKNEQDIIQAKPNFELMTKNGFGHLMITAQNETKNVDFVVRCFAPISGINEDPVTGSAHCALTPLWAEKLGKLEMKSLQVSARTGRLDVTLIDDRVIIKGNAISIFEANLKI